MLPDITLFSQLLMLREYEVLFWASLNTADDLAELLTEGSETEVTMAVKNRLLHTAFFLK